MFDEDFSMTLQRALEQDERGVHYVPHVAQLFDLPSRPPNVCFLAGENVHHLGPLTLHVQQTPGVPDGTVQYAIFVGVPDDVIAAIQGNYARGRYAKFGIKFDDKFRPIRDMKFEDDLPPAGKNGSVTTITAWHEQWRILDKAMKQANTATVGMPSLRFWLGGIQTRAYFRIVTDDDAPRLEVTLPEELCQSLIEDWQAAWCDSFCGKRSNA